MNIRERANEIKGIFYTSCKDIILEPPRIKKTESQKYMGDGTISAEIKFIDNYLLNFSEEITGRNITRYMYEYICLKTGFFFVYENEGKANGIIKPLHHLHVGIKKDYFNEFMGMIIVNFFKDHRNCEKMLRSLLR